jgi:hypothetical protein
MPDTPSAAQMAVSEHALSVLQIQDNAARRGALCLWTIYDHPRDYPQGICARRHELAGGKSTPTEHLLVGELGFLRAIFREAKLVCICRQENDDKPIVETWI